MDKIISLNVKNNGISPKKYVKFSAFIGLLNEIQRTKNVNSKGGNLIDFRIDIGTKTAPLTICGSFPSIFSVDDSVFIPNEAATNWYNDVPYYKYCEPNRGAPGPLIIDNSVHSLSGNKVSFPIKTSTVSVGGTPYTFPVGTVGWIGDIYIDNDLAMESLKNTSGDIKDVIDSLLKELSEATDGMWNFQCKQDDTDKYKLVIVDGNLMNSPGGGGISPLELWYHGPNSVFLNASFNFDIPKGMANRIVMQRANKDRVADQPGLRALFSNATDMVITDNFIAAEVQSSGTTQPAADETEKLENWKGFRQYSRILVQPIISKLGVNTIGKDISDYLLPGNCSNNELFNKLRKKNS